MRYPAPRDRSEALGPTPDPTHQMINHPAKMRPPLIAIGAFLDYYAALRQRAGRTVFCFQVGANDGRSNDPVHRYFRDYAWRGLLIEPQRDVFEQGLARTYADNPRVTLRNVALGTEDGSLPFYRVAISNERWAHGLSSFVRSSLEEHIRSGYIARKAHEQGLSLPDDPGRIIETVQVPTRTVSTLLKEHGIDFYDVLCIDTEGYDFEILKLFDFERYRPDVVLFESNNLSEADFVAAHALLRRFGYRLFWEKGDTLAVRIPYPLHRRLLHQAKGYLRRL